MKSGPPDHSAPGSPTEENDPLWRLLAQAPPPEPDAWFTMRTLARCRREGAGHGWGLISRLQMWRWALGGCMSVAVVVTLLGAHFHADKVDNKQKNVQEAFEIMASIDSDADNSSLSSSWQDTSL